MKYSVQLIVKTIVPVEDSCAHGLFGHLALIHISGRLVVVHEGDVLGEDRQVVTRVDLLVTALG